MNSKDILIKAVQCDKAGRILEAQSNYQEGIQILLELVEDETDVAKKKVYYEMIKENIDRAEQIKIKVQRHASQCTLVAYIPIDENSTGHSYKTLFGKYVNSDVKEVLLEEPYLVERYQFQNLIVFFELLVKNCSDLKYIRVVTKPDPKNPAGQLSVIQQMIADLSIRNITLTFKFEDSLHDRKILLSNGFIVKIGRGLNFYKANNSLYSLGLVDYDFRRCLQTEVDILRYKNF